MFAKNSIFSLISLVVFIALAAVSSYLYNGSSEKSAELDETALVGKIKVVAEMAWQAGGSWLVDVSEFEQGPDSSQVTGKNSESWPEWRSKLQEEWDKSGTGQPDFLSYISEEIEKIRNNIQDLLAN